MSESLGMMPAANMGFPVLMASLSRLTTVPFGQSIDKAVAYPAPMKVACAQKASEPPILPKVY